MIHSKTDGQTDISTQYCVGGLILHAQTQQRNDGVSARAIHRPRAVRSSVIANGGNPTCERLRSLQTANTAATCSKAHRLSALTTTTMAFFAAFACLFELLLELRQSQAAPSN